MYRILSIFTVLILVNSVSLFGQKDINSYKYVIVPDQYEFQKSEDQYQINSLTKFLFAKDGFTVLSSSHTFPTDLAQNPCLALKVLLKDDSGMFTTKVRFDLVDCYNSVVFSGEEGRSKIKDFKKAFHEATRNAFVSIDSLNYKYNGTVVSMKGQVASQNAVVTKTPIAEKQSNVVVAPQPVDSKPEKSEKQIKDEKVAVPVVKEEVVIAAPVIVEDVVEKPVEQVKEPKVEKKQTYFIEGSYLIDVWGKCEIVPKGNGYVVVGGDENYEFATISKTSKPNFFMVKKTGFKQSQLLELNTDGNIQIDSETGVKIYKRVN